MYRYNKDGLPYKVKVHNHNLSSSIKYYSKLCCADCITKQCTCQSFKSNFNQEITERILFNRDDWTESELRLELDAGYQTTGIKERSHYKLFYVTWGCSIPAKYRENQ